MDETEFLIELSRRLGLLGQRIARRAIESQRIRDILSTTVEVVSTNEVLARLTVPYYWAVYYHDGRGPIRAKPGRFLVFFKDPDNDPRIGGPARNYPVRERQVRRLSREQFYRALRANQIVVTKRVGPAGGNPFFTEGMRTFPRAAGRFIKGEFSRYVRSTLRAEGILNVKL